MMGVLPLQFLDSDGRESLGSTGREEVPIEGIENAEAREVAVRTDGKELRRAGAARHRPGTRVPAARRHPPLHAAPPARGLRAILDEDGADAVLLCCSQCWPGSWPSPAPRGRSAPARGGDSLADGWARCMYTRRADRLQDGDDAVRGRARPALAVAVVDWTTRPVLRSRAGGAALSGSVHCLGGGVLSLGSSSFWASSSSWSSTIAAVESSTAAATAVRDSSARASGS